AVPRDRPGRRVVERPAAGAPPAPDREPRLRDPARRAPGRRVAPDDGHEPRLAEPRRLAAAPAPGRPERASRPVAPRDLDGCGARARAAGTARALLRRLGNGVRRL